MIDNTPISSRPTEEPVTIRSVYRTMPRREKIEFVLATVIAFALGVLVLRVW